MQDEMVILFLWHSYNNGFGFSEQHIILFQTLPSIKFHNGNLLADHHKIEALIENVKKA